MFLAIHPSSLKSSDELAWCLYREGDIVKRGSSSKEDPDLLLRCWQQVRSHENGFVVAFDMKDRILEWFQETLSNEDFTSLDDMNVCQLYDFHLYRSVDEDCYYYWTLPELHTKLYPGDDVRRVSTIAIYW